jgi:hypothetical protein
MNQSTSGLPHDVVYPSPKASFLFLLDDSQYLFLALVVVIIPRFLETFINLLSSILLTMDSEAITLLNAGLEMPKNFLHQKGQAVGYPTLSGSPFKIPLVANEPSMIVHK